MPSPAKSSAIRDVSAGAPRALADVGPPRAAGFASVVPQVARVLSERVGRKRWQSAAEHARLLGFGALQQAWEVATRLSRDPDLGFSVAAAFTWGDRGLADQLLLGAPDLRTVAARQREWGQLTGEFVQHDAREEDELVWLVVTSPEGVTQHRASQDLYAARLSSFVQRVRQRAEGPVGVRFKYARPLSLAAHRRAFGPNCALSFGCATLELAIPRAWFDAPLPGHDRAQFARLEARARAFRDLTHKGLLEERLVQRVADEARALLERPGPSLRAVAERLGTSERTLRRRLHASGSPWRSVLDRLRIVQLELAHTQLPLRRSEAARALGFANEGALRRAMRRWQRQAPETEDETRARTR